MDSLRSQHPRGRAAIPIYELRDAELRRFDPFPLETPCTQRPAIRHGVVCDSRWGVFDGHGGAHCQRCGSAVPMPVRPGLRVGEA